jgi:hypothetical protein
MKIGIRTEWALAFGGSLLFLSYSSVASSEDFFDRYPNLGKSVGAEKLTGQERERLSSLIEGVVEISSSGKAACEDKSKQTCRLTHRECMSTCVDNAVFDYESGTHRRNTNLGDICARTCRMAEKACTQ